ncbi:MAG: 16S rRNA (adenine(1518)-N(6)/adenine(1519)-N(6))-dimethyltransferase RsmA, partial [Phycisphaerae bacterium]|nr:16S rRNA (adenine(1518)-N(6)/adenine(1519)-N(6))-dimethyltransferase RsmA [Phycisphaerae bacterium]
MVQTQTEIQTLLENAGIHPSRRFGQNFLIDGNLMNILVASADLAALDVVLEVGAGTGNLTELLAARAGCVISVEVDAGLAEIARDRLAGAANVEILHTDVLKSKHHIDSGLMARVSERLAEGAGRRFKLVANLPYSVASPLLAELLLHRPVPVLMVFTVQMEVAERIAASPGSRTYGPLAVILQALGAVEIIRRLPASVFWPRPRVSSAMVRIVPSDEKRGRIRDIPLFRTVIEGLFGYRRKRCAKSLSFSAATRDLCDDWPALLTKCG